jgi:hypothetical protein
MKYACKLVAAIMVLSGVVALLWSSRKMSVPAPIQVLQTHETRILEYIDSIRHGKIPRRDDGRGFAVLDVLVNAGATQVRTEDNCVVITFGFMPTDAVPELIYCADGFDPLPTVLLDRKRKAYFEMTTISPQWIYCRWDM